MIRKILKIVVLMLVALFVAIQFVRIDRTNPPVVAGETLESAVSLPADVSMVLSRSCNDCHSHKTTFPWYAQVQPAAFFLDDHILEGRHHLNFSKFNTYEPKKKDHKLEEICDEVTSGAMPLPSYLWIHGDATLSQSESKLLCDWTKQERAKIGIVD